MLLDPVAQAALGYERRIGEEVYQRLDNVLQYLDGQKVVTHQGRTGRLHVERELDTLTGLHLLRAVYVTITPDDDSEVGIFVLTLRIGSVTRRQDAWRVAIRIEGGTIHADSINFTTIDIIIAAIICEVKLVCKLHEAPHDDIARSFELSRSRPW